MQRSYVSGHSSTSLIGLTIGEKFDLVASAHPDTEALISLHQGLRYTYSELQAEVDRCARALIASGIEAGERVGIWSPNKAEWMIIQYATAKMGAILVNINPAYRTSELEYALKQSGVRTLIATTEFRDTDYTAMITAVEDDLPDLHEVILLGEATGKAASWSDFLARADGVGSDALASRLSSLDFDDPINIQYTSGTTGFPKGATLSHHNILNNGFFIGERMALSPNDRICVPVPFYHCFGMVLANLAAMTHGATIILPGEAFQPRDSLQAVTEEACTALYGVPTMFIAELSLDDFGSFDLTTLRTGIMAGSPCPVEVMKKVMSEMHMDEVTICYGMTETSPVSFQSNIDDDIETRVSTVGTIHPHVEAKIVDPETGHTLSRGETGELCTRGYPVMLGYWGNEEATGEAIDTARWMHTGDLAEMRDDGYVNIVGRIKDMVIRGGENVYPREVEEFLYTHPNIDDVQVIGVPDEKYGEQVCAWVRLKEGTEIGQDDIKEFCRGKIASFKIPHYIHFTDDFPMTVTGKVQKYKMREASIEELGLATQA